MSTAPIPSKAQKSRKEKDKDKEKERKASLPQQNERLKTVVRRLPPNLPEVIFWQSVQQWVTEETAVWKLYCQGKLRKKLNKENIPSRAYIAFRDEEKLALFSREYDGHVFRDKAGVESQAVVEFAPYPKVPSEKRKPDPRNATIEKDEDYISFLEILKAAENAEPVTLESLIAASQPVPHPKTTPLLEALKAEKSANKDKEAILRNHAHYNNMNVTSLRKEDKKKGAGAPASAKAEINGTSAANSQATGNSKKAQKKAQVQASASQNAKPTQQGAVAPAAKGGAGVNAAASSAKPTKPSRPPRGQAKAVTATTAGAAGGEATRAPTILAAPSAETAIATPPAPAPAPAAPRRTRPVIGLANRQFEAALSGVSGLASAATERKKREKEREAQAAATGVTVSPTTTTTGTSFARIDGSDMVKPPSPVSPKKEKTRRGGRGGGGGGGGGGSGGAAGVPQMKVPSILQRAPDASAPSVAQQASTATPLATPNGVISINAAAGGNAPLSGGAGRGGARRGRGGGRGRGAPNPARGGG